jgi:hypothetical protein
MEVYALLNIQFKLLKMAIEIGDLPIKNGGSFHSYVNVYQRVKQWGFTLFFLSRHEDLNGFDRGFHWKKMNFTRSKF